jgi:hypothetical protein
MTKECEDRFESTFLVDGETNFNRSEMKHGQRQGT